MSESAVVRPDYEARRERAAARHLELRDLFADLAVRAQVVLDARALGADRVTVDFGDYHELTLRRPRGSDPTTGWEIDRLFYDAATALRQQTIVNNHVGPSPRKGGNPLRIDVASYWPNPTAMDERGRYTGPLCGYFNGYEGAERYIAELRRDLVAALALPLSNEVPALGQVSPVVTEAVAQVLS